MKSRYNFFDILVFLILLFLVVSIIVLNKNSKTTYSKKVDMVISADVNGLSEANIQKDKSVFVNSVNLPVELVGTQKRGNEVLIELRAPGEINGSQYIFNGQRVLINQKAEIHSSYFLQGKIVDVQYAN